MTTLSEVLAAIDDGVSRFGAPTPYADLMSSNYLRANRDRLLRAEAMLAAVESEAWKCVPVEATEAMLRAGVEGVYGPATYKCVSRTGTELYEQEADSNYTAMLAAAPAAPGVEG